MINVSNQFLQAMENDNRNYLCYVYITLSDGTILNIDDTDIWQNSFSIEGSVSSEDGFSIGAANVGQLTITLNNIEEKFSSYDFTDASVIAYTGLQLSENTEDIEKIRHGVYTVDEASYNGSLITLTCLDQMIKLDVPYSDVNTTYPATVSTIIQDIALHCGVTLIGTIDNGSFEIKTRPEDNEYTCRAILAHACQVVGSFAYFDEDGKLQTKWYDTSLFEKGNQVDGGDFVTYTSENQVDGGDFKNYENENSVSGGKFTDLRKYHHIFSYNSLTISTDDVVITGIKATVGDNEYSFGTDDYSIKISNNPFITDDNAESIVQYLGNKIVGMRFRPFSVSCLSDPTIQPGDCVYITDIKQNTYQSYITRSVYNPDTYNEVSCIAETPARNKANIYSQQTAETVKNRTYYKTDLSNYNKTVQQMSQLAANTMGFYYTEQEQEDGSIISYQHDKPNLSDSKVIYKRGIDGFFVSTDGGQTYVSGFDSSGNAVLNILSAIGVVADWIKAGTIEGEVVAKNLIMEGGKIQVTTDSYLDNIIKMISGLYSNTMTPSEVILNAQDSVTRIGSAYMQMGDSSDDAKVVLSGTNGTGIFSGHVSAEYFQVGSSSGVTGTFTTANGKTVTVDGGLITSIA